jgi:hypothetical protein
VIGVFYTNQDCQSVALQKVLLTAKVCKCSEKQIRYKHFSHKQIFHHQKTRLQFLMQQLSCFLHASIVVLSTGFTISLLQTDCEQNLSAKGLNA